MLLHDLQYYGNGARHALSDCYVGCIMVSVYLVITGMGQLTIITEIESCIVLKSTRNNGGHYWPSSLFVAPTPD
jgi:hypothetical protein